MIERIQLLHQHGYTHNDIKLANTLIGNNDPDVIYLIDFGLCEKYLNEDGTHVSK